MQTSVLEVTQVEALQHLKLYKQHVNTPGSVDWEIERIYREISKGNTVIQAFESIKNAGFDEKGRPKLAIVQAAAQRCFCRADSTEVFFRDWAKRQSPGIKIPWPMAPGEASRLWNSAVARVPLVPVHLRPKTKLEKYHILWEADWEDVPVDPMLLRRIGQADAWVVLAAWDLTAVERAVLRSREVRQ